MATGPRPKGRRRRRRRCSRGSERWFAELTNKQVRRGVHRSVAEVEIAIRAFIDAPNADPKPFVWTKTADQILASIARFAQRTVDDHPAELMARTKGPGH